ncbi:hypothetical protein [Suttonella ornithocola]|uniref:Uncharacterized protein n=1 Tax=Suttonella ornithocola TaxID=279832 RepID=A0A380MU64_9GAMM|nr:hypothetical protein [Suttonella ornithocola]SUO96140.1 Uncharacterised protein [Suttonella ornithocola]
MKILYFPSNSYEFSKWAIDDNNTVIATHPYCRVYYGKRVFNVEDAIAKIEKGERAYISVELENKHYELKAFNFLVSKITDFPIRSVLAHEVELRKDRAIQLLVRNHHYLAKALKTAITEVEQSI